MDNGAPHCIAFGGLRVDDAIENALLAVVGPGAIAAATAAEKEVDQRRDQVREALGRGLEAARYAADRAFRQYDAAGVSSQSAGRGRTGGALEQGAHACGGGRCQDRGT